MAGSSIRLPINPFTLFTVGALFVTFAGFWTGGTYGARAYAEANAAELARSPTVAKAVVTSASNYRSSEGYSVDYNFKTKTGQVFSGYFYDRA